MDETYDTRTSDHPLDAQPLECPSSALQDQALYGEVQMNIYIYGYSNDVDYDETWGVCSNPDIAQKQCEARAKKDKQHYGSLWVTTFILDGEEVNEWWTKVMYNGFDGKRIVSDWVKYG